jgi:hypothetical protein
MGHELTHGFDDQGRLYNGDGKLEDWWENVTAQKFLRKVSLVRLYCFFLFHLFFYLYLFPGSAVIHILFFLHYFLLWLIY